MLALIKNDIIPRLIRYFCLKDSLYCLRIAITCVISISLKVVSMAVFCLASSKRAAMRRRSGLIGLRVTGSASGKAAAGWISAGDWAASGTIA